jgi:Cu/Ag efflux pump CusA
MIDAILLFSVRQRWLVMIGVLLMAGLGVWNFMRLPIDAVPDITNVRSRLTRTRRDTHRSKSSSGSPFRSRPPWADFRTW